MGVTVDAPDGRTWHVTRHLQWPHWRGWGDDDPLANVPFVDFGPDLGDSPLGGILLAVALFVAVGLLILILLPVILLLVEVILAVAATTIALRPWVVRGTTVGPPADERTWGVRGFLRSRRAMAEVADELRLGVHAEPATWEPVA
jgi:hypothetical protein